MPLTQSMRNLLAKFTTTESVAGESFGSTGSYIHVGSSTGAFDSAQNSLLSTAPSIRPMEANYPTRATNLLTFRSLFATNEANHPWEEWMVKNSTASSTSAGTGMQRKQEALGTKAATQAWLVTASVTVST